MSQRPDEIIIVAPHILELEEALLHARNSESGLALVSTIITLAHSLQLKVVAEGVETEEQSRLLKLFGCDEVQGYLFSRPLPRKPSRRGFSSPRRESDRRTSSGPLCGTAQTGASVAA